MAGADVAADEGVENVMEALGSDAQADLSYVPGRLRRKLTPYQPVSYTHLTLPTN